MINSIILISLSTLCISFAIAYSITLKRLARLTQECAKLFIDNKTLEEFIATNNVEFKNDSDIHKENFIKFLSDSRDWAFDYIEDVQKGLSRFIEEVEPQLEYYNEYGVVIEGMVPPHDFALKKISKEFEELKKLLPEETDDRR